MKIFLKRFFIALISAIIILPLVAIITAFILEDSIKNQIVTEVNKQLAVPVKVSGKINFTVLKYFPNAALEFEQVAINNKLKVGEKQLAEVQSFSLLFSLSDIVKNKFTIHSIALKNGAVNILVDKDGNSNLDILKDGKESKQDAELKVNRVLLSNIKISYNDFKSEFKAGSRVRKLQLDGDFTAAKFVLKSKGDFFVEKIAAGENQLVANKQLNVDILLNISNYWKEIAINKAELSIEKTPFDVNGNFKFGQDKTTVFFVAKTEGENIAELIALLPQNLRKTFEETNGKGAFELNIQVDGIVSKLQSPVVTVKAKLKDAVVELPKVKKELKHVFADIEYGSNKGGVDYLNITDCRSQISSASFRFSLFLKNLPDPEFLFDANGTLYLSELGAFVPDSIMKNFSGNIIFRNFNINGMVKDLTEKPENVFANGSGNFTLQDIAFEAGGVKYKNINGLITYSAQKLAAKDLKISFLNTDAVFNGNVSGLAPFASALAKRKPMNNLVLDADGDLKINKLDLSELIKTFSSAESEKSKSKLDIKNVFRMNGNLSLSIQQFVYNKMEFNDVKVSLTLSPLHLRLNKFSTQTMGGTANGNGYFVFMGDKDLLMNFGAELNDIDITEVFKETENFGQTTLTANNISGTANAKVYLKNTWKNYEEIDPDNLNAIIDFEIKNGRLKDFEPVKAASKFIKVEELSDIKFSDIKNRLSIYNKTVFIPSFEIKSNAVNLIFSGEHHFDNTVDYHFKVNLRRLLANKFNRAGREQFIENDPYDGLNVYLSLTGNLANPTVKYDKSSANAKIKEDWKGEKDVLKNLFNKDKTPKGEKREEKYFQIDEQPTFMDFEEEK
ncbi:MAG TPA: AsmA-like C-terminal region-containing protein [Chitinophagales bacterium]|nr:AsmA-like C-terminal region-containing protein [Chitinophagales bacterium]